MTGQVVTLKHPITFGEEVISQIELNEPSLGDLEVLDKCHGHVAQVLNIISISSGHPLPVVKRIKVSDLESITAVVGNFFPDGLPTGGN